MRSILEKAFVALLNEEHDKAEEMFHKFIVERARQIHESNRAGEDFVLDENWEEEITTESYFTEEDLADLEDGDGSEEAGEENPFAAADDAEGDEFGDDAAGADDAAGDLGADLGADDADVAADDFGGDDMGAEADAGSIESLEDKIDELTAKFEAMMDAIGADDAEGDFDADADMQADDAEGDFGADTEVDADSVEDDMDGADAQADDAEQQDDDAEQFGESEEGDDEFDDINESIIDELEKIQVSLTTDGVEIAAGKSFQQNKTSSIPQKSKEARQGGEPVKQKVTNHKHFNRETAPTVSDMKARKNTLKKADSTQSKVSKEGDASAEINKIDSNGNNKSLTPGGKPGFKAK